MRIVPCIKAGVTEQNSFLSFFNVQTKGDALLPCVDVEIKQIRSNAGPDQTTYPPVLFLGILRYENSREFSWNSRDMRDNIVPFVGYKV
jgi:hypothetical protein